MNVEMDVLCSARRAAPTNTLLFYSIWSYCCRLPAGNFFLMFDLFRTYKLVMAIRRFLFVYGDGKERIVSRHFMDALGNKT